jgi:hypothetical protein
MSKKTIKQEVTIEIDRLTNSIVNALSGDVFETEFHKVYKREIKKKDWYFDWHLELAKKECTVYKMTIKENLKVIQGLISIEIKDNFVFVSLVENAKFNRGKDKIFVGVGGNLFAFACKNSIKLGFGGFVGFISKTTLVSYYQKKLGAEVALGQRMFISDTEAVKLVNHYFKIKK